MSSPSISHNPIFVEPSKITKKRKLDPSILLDKRVKLFAGENDNSTIENLQNNYTSAVSKVLNTKDCVRQLSCYFYKKEIAQLLIGLNTSTYNLLIKSKTSIYIKNNKEIHLPLIRNNNSYYIEKHDNFLRISSRYSIVPSLQKYRGVDYRGTDYRWIDYRWVDICDSFTGSKISQQLFECNPYILCALPRCYAVACDGDTSNMRAVQIWSLDEIEGQLKPQSEPKNILMNIEPDRVFSLAVLSNGFLVGGMAMTGLIQAWDLTRNEPIKIFTSEQRNLKVIALQELFFASIGSEGIVEIWHLESTTPYLQKQFTSELTQLIDYGDAGLGVKISDGSVVVIPYLTLQLRYNKKSMISKADFDMEDFNASTQNLDER